MIRRNRKRCFGLIRRNRFEVVGHSLVFAAGVIVAVVFVSIMIMEFENARKLSDAVNGNMIELAAAVKDSGVTMYDGVKVLGADVLNFGKKYFGAASGPGPFVMRVTADSGQSVVVSDKEELLELVRISALGSDPGAVGPTDEYLGTVIRNDNGIITEVSFSKV